MFGAGGGESYVLVVANAEALETCQRLRLPCYNATVHLSPDFFSSYTFATWAKVLMTRMVLKALPPDLNLHLSDHDVVRGARVALGQPSGASASSAAPCTAGSAWPAGQCGTR